MSSLEIIYKIVSTIPKGKVLTYGEVAKRAGIKSPRLVGNILHKNTDPDKVPCHRVVNRKGEVAGNYGLGGGVVQKKRLQAEGIEFVSGKINLEKYFWKEPL